MILDGWGKANDPKVSAVDIAKTPFLDKLYHNYPSSFLLTDGLHVGLPEGQMGNSEVGHLNLGAGRIVYQNLTRINLAVQHKTLAAEKTIHQAFEYAKSQHKPVHFLGLVSDGGVHAHITHLKGLVDAAVSTGLDQLYIHAFTDGRDVDPKSGVKHLTALQDYLSGTPAKLASVIGRYYSMDRDKRWDRIAKAYHLLVSGKGTKTINPIVDITKSYREGITDEFLLPLSVTDNSGQPIATIKEGDVVVFFNFRTDRGRQLTEALTQTDFPEQQMKKIGLYFVTMTNYDQTFKNIHVVYDNEDINQTLGEVISDAGKKQIRIAETEKYPHVTFFFSGGRETPFEGEIRILRDSPKVATYDLKPEMSAYELTEALLPEIKNKIADFICLNFANGDMVGHTGNLEAAVKACEAVDQCIEKVVEQALLNQYTTLIIADHGNCETMKNPDGTPNTAHTTNPVPIIIVDPNIKAIKSGILADIAPTVLALMGINKPTVMTGHSLL